MCGSLAVRDWMKQELCNAKLLLDRADAEISAVDAARGAATLRMFSRSMQRYMRRFKRACEKAGVLAEVHRREYPRFF